VSRADKYTAFMPIVMKSGSLNLLELSGPVQAFTRFIYRTIWSVNGTPRAYVWKPYASMVVLILGVQNIKKKLFCNLISHFVKNEERARNLTGYKYIKAAL